jgi:hypothetical protein
LPAKRLKKGIFSVVDAPAKRVAKKCVSLCIMSFSCLIISASEITLGHIARWLPDAYLRHGWILLGTLFCLNVSLAYWLDKLLMKDKSLFIWTVLFFQLLICLCCFGGFVILHWSMMILFSIPGPVLSDKIETP